MTGEKKKHTKLHRFGSVRNPEGFVEESENDQKCVVKTFSRIETKSIEILVSQI